MDNVNRDDLYNLLTKFTRNELRAICFRLDLPVDFGEELDAERITLRLISTYELRGNTPERGRAYLGDDLIKIGVAKQSVTGKLVRADALEDNFSAIPDDLPAYSSSTLLRRILPRLSLNDVRTWTFYMEEEEPQLGYELIEGVTLDAKIRALIKRAGDLNERTLLVRSLNSVRPDVLHDDFSKWLKWAGQADRVSA